MKATGIVRRIDDRGNVVVPKQIRRAIGLNEEDEVLITVDSTVGITIAKYHPESDVRGIFTRIDDLGRVRIPLRVQKLLNITEGTPLEIFLNDTGSVIFVKYGEAEEDLTEAESDLSVLLNAMQMSIKTDASVFELFKFIGNFDKDVIVQALAIFLHDRRERCKTLIKDHPRLKGEL